MHRKDAGLNDNLPKVYRIYGFTMASEYPFANRLEQGSGCPDITFTCVAEPPISSNWLKTKPLFSSSNSTEDKENTISIHRLKGFDVVHFTHMMDFYLGSNRIICHLLDPAFDYLVEIRLLGDIFSLWLERNGVLALHASAVAINGRATAFLSTNSGGKSTLSASLMQKGHPMLTDDILPIVDRGRDFFGCPGYPQMRMWPDQAEHFLGRYQDLPVVHPSYTKLRIPVGPDGLGVFCSEERPLDVFYLPVRTYDEDNYISIDPVSPRDAVIEFIRNTFNPVIVDALGVQEQRMSFLARLASKVPMRRLLYPAGYNHLPRVGDAIIDDSKSL